MNKTKIDLRILLFFIWPFGAFLTTFFSISSRRSNLIYILFTTLFGYAFSFIDTSADSYRVALVFNEFDYRGIPFIFNDYLSGYHTDLYRYFLYSLVKGVTYNPKILFAFFGFVFGIFSYKSLRLFFNVKGLEKGISIFILCIIFIALNSVVNINGARFNTAAIICFCSVINLIAYNKKIWILGLLSTFLFHFSFLFIIPFLLLMYVFRERLFTKSRTSTWIFILFVVTFLFSLISESNLINLNVVSRLLPISMANKVDIYNSSDITALYADRGKTVFHRVSNTFSYISRCYIFFFILRIKSILKNTTLKNPELQRLFNFVLMFLSVTFILSIFPSGGRFLAISTQVFFFFLIRFYVTFKSNVLQKYIWGLLPFYAFLIAFNLFYLCIVLTSSTIWYGNLFWIIYEGIGYTFVY